MNNCSKSNCIFRGASNIICTLHNCSHKTVERGNEDMNYLGNMITLYANAWLEKNNLEWTEDNWREATLWASSHSAKECRDYLTTNLI